MIPDFQRRGEYVVLPRGPVVREQVWKSEVGLRRVLGANLFRVQSGYGQAKNPGRGSVSTRAAAESSERRNGVSCAGSHVS